eukprot:5669467-Prymnesium_polylepis.1
MDHASPTIAQELHLQVTRCRDVLLEEDAAAHASHTSLARACAERVIKLHINQHRPDAAAGAG